MHLAKWFKKHRHLLFHKHLLAPLVAALLVGGGITFSFIPHSFDTSGLRVEIAANTKAAEYESPIIGATEFNALFVRMHESGGMGHADMQVRFRTDAVWSDWRGMEWDEEEADGGGDAYHPDHADDHRHEHFGHTHTHEDGDDFLHLFTKPHDLRTGTSMVAPSDAYQFRIQLLGEPGFFVDEILLETRDMTKRSSLRFLDYLVPQAVGQITDLGIISRETWGADPSYLWWYQGRGGHSNTSVSGEQITTARGRLCAEWQRNYPEDFTKDGFEVGQDLSGNDLYWEREYSPHVDKIVVHHTASTDRDVDGDGDYDADDAAALVRAIYFRHAVYNDWGDVGYHYIIDPFGNIYEGRSGGERVIGAHVYCANTQTIGVSLIGNFNDDRPTEAAIDSLSQLVGELANIYDVDLQAETEWHGRTTPGLVGHRDYGYTSCPGTHLYARMDEIRTTATNYALANRPSDEDYDYQITDSNSPLQLVPLDRDTFSFNLKNSGKKAWPAGTTFTLNRSDMREASGGAQVNANRIQVLRLDRSLPAGDSVVLELPIVAGLDEGRYRFGIVPDFGPEEGSTLFAVVNVGTPVMDYEVVGAQHPPRPFPQGSSTEAYVELRNKSNFTWKASGDQRAYLMAVEPEGRVSDFTESNIMGYLDRDVTPGETGKFIMHLTAPAKNQRYVERFAPAIDSFGMLPDYGMYFDIMVREPRFSAAVISRPGGDELRLLPNETKILQLTLKNTSQLTWDPEHFSMLPVRTRSITLREPTGRINREVLPGEDVTIPIEVTAPPRGGKALLSLRPSWANGKSRVDDPIDFAFDIADPVLSSQLVDVAVEGTTVTASYQNTGTFVWTNWGDNPVKLGTAVPQDRSSIVSAPDWVATTRPALLAQREVRPGEVGVFQFSVALPAERSVEVFAPVMEYIGWMKSSPLKLRVDPDTVEFVGTTSELIADVLAADAPEPELETRVLSAPRSGERGPDVRIRLGFQSNEVVIGGGIFSLQNMNGDEIFRGTVADFDARKMKNGQFYRVEPIGATILEIANWNHTPGWTDEISDNKYRGALEIWKLGGTLLVINDLPLEDYLRGVAEPLPTDPSEKAKALAMMARSYALFYIDPANRKYPSQPYDGSDDPAEFQKYLGYNYELRGNMPQYVEETRGQVLTLDGAVVKTPYFTQSGGRTKTAAEARWNPDDFRFTVSVEDPWSCELDSSALGTSYSCPENAKGHGVGASGKGMTGLANEGKTAAEIVEYFYDGLAITQQY